MAYVNADTISGHHLSGSHKLVPLVTTGSYSFDRATTPAASTETDRAHYVIINVPHATKYEFKYIEGGDWVDYGVASGSVSRVDIQPVAWRGGAGTTGHVTFVYKGR
tara:strand:- start:143 stop:463 length:321 start_codon:yes stop_codon:yes gene_type:complete